MLKPTLKKRFKVETIEIFGSYARREQNNQSDLDILVTYSENEAVSLLTVARLRRYLRRKLHIKVDIVSKEFFEQIHKRSSAQRSGGCMKHDHLERSPKVYLQEIVDFIERIEDYTKGMTYVDFSKDRRTIDAVDANIRNIGEAVRVLSKHRRIKELFYHFGVPYADLSDMRTDLTHEYFSINVKIVWDTATKDLPRLKLQFKKVLEQL